ncbi:MAG TPA: hypothetical protein VGX48_26385 [Pyrinomonadaceae bacterium]|jgi:hypothetical protein|nr:hypothetical protein [Pyrinomonadaceae bacterium]
MRDALRLVQKLLGLLLLGCGTVMFLSGVVISLLFRDGLGPDSVPSHGFEAAVRFAREFWQFLLVSVLLWAAGGLLLRRVIP